MSILESFLGKKKKNPQQEHTMEQPEKRSVDQNIPTDNTLS
ncbi:MAG: hypothetical protein ACOX2X_05840 [Peptococcia bacterium]